MSADLNTTITLQGTSEELLAMLKVLKRFETQMQEQYKTSRDCGYIEWVTVDGASGSCSPEEMTEEQMQSFLADAGNKLEVDAAGPWGSFNFPGDVGLFEALAQAAPTAYLLGEISGFITGADVWHRAELKDGLLYLSDFCIPDDEIPELYVKAMKKQLSHAKFCKLFHADKEEFDADCYADFIVEAFDEGFPDDMDYDTFLEFCDCAELDEDQYEAAIEKLSELDLVDMETFRESIDEEDYAQKRIYDTNTGKYKKAK